MSTAESAYRVVIVGASVAGTRTARSLRGEGFAGEVLLIDAETEQPYDKPPLSKQLLAGVWDSERIRLWTAQDVAALDVHMRLGEAAVRLDPAAGRLTVTGGDEIDFDVCVVATGSHARPSPWQPAGGLHVLRSLRDALRLRTALQAGGHVVIVGAGFIGAEVAGTALTYGCAVTLVDPLPAPMEPLLGAVAAAALASLHSRHGVVTRFGTGVEDMTGSAGALRVLLTDGEELRADTVVVGIGARPNTSWLDSSGLLIDNGLVCDEFCRALGSHRVFAAGDVARWNHRRHGGNTRVEHWTNAVEQAACVARNIVHPEDLQAYEPIGYVWSNQHDRMLQILGEPDAGAAQVTVGDLADGRGAVLYATGAGLLQGAFVMGWPKVAIAARNVLGAGGRVDDVLTAVGLA